MTSISLSITNISTQPKTIALFGIYNYKTSDDIVVDCAPFSYSQAVWQIYERHFVISKLKFSKQSGNKIRLTSSTGKKYEYEFPINTNLGLWLDKHPEMDNVMDSGTELIIKLDSGEIQNIVLEGSFKYQVKNQMPSNIDDILR